MKKNFSLLFFILLLSFVFSQNITTIDLSTGKNLDNTIIPERKVDLDWSVTGPLGNKYQPYSRNPAPSAWSSAMLEENYTNHVWITNLAPDGPGDYQYKSKTFTIPENATNAILKFKPLAFLIQTSYLVKKGSNNSETQTEISITTSSNAIYNSRTTTSNLSLSPGEYYIKVNVRENANQVYRNSLNVASYVQYETPIIPLSEYKNAPNSYIFDPSLENFEGLYIPVKKAYAMWQDTNGYLNQPIPNGQLSAYVQWEDIPGLVRSDDHFKLDLVGIGENAKIKIPVNKAAGEGNAVVSLHVGNTGTSNDPVYWSWHVWVTDTPQIGGSNTGVTDNMFNLDKENFLLEFMDRNLGATHNHFLGNGWDKSQGLMYQWGRKDPFPSLVHKDYSYYQVDGINGSVKHRISQSLANNTMNNFMFVRPYDDINSNIKYSIQNPFHYIYTTEARAHWFTKNVNRGIPTSNEFLQYNLWSDNYGGDLGSKWPNQSSHKTYQLKSSYDPCPKDWRVPSSLDMVANHTGNSPWGRSGSDGGADDKNFHSIKRDLTHQKINGVKVYPGLGLDFNNVNNRSIGVYPLTGNYERYSPNTPLLFQDIVSEANIWTATSYNGQGKQLKITADYARTDKGAEAMIGLNEFYHSTITEYSEVGQAVRCIVDPNSHKISNFETEYIPSNLKHYTKGLKNPNSYILEDNQKTLSIPINKAFAVYNLYLTENEWPTGNLSTKIEWTTNKNLITKVELLNANINNPDNGEIKVTIGNGNPKGNAVISLTSNNEVLWSWHIWAPKDSPIEQPITYTNEDAFNSLNFINFTKSGIPALTTTFMDRNLGAIESFPYVNDPNNLTNEEKLKINESGGLHFQWGRKDPIPTFEKSGLNSEKYTIFRESGKDSNNNSIYNTTITDTSYLDLFSKTYSNYGITGNAKKEKKTQKSLKYSVNNPLTFMYHSDSNFQDWISDEKGLANNRWGHANEKSPFDPCPEGWRVPDVSFSFFGYSTIENSSKGISSGAIGSSPWYNKNIINGPGEEQNRHLIQDRAYQINGILYDGTWIKDYGWIFNKPSYFIGNFPLTGIRGEINGNKFSSKNTFSGLWTSSLTDVQNGQAIALVLNGNNNISTVKSGGGINTQAGMNVRCAKDEPRYLGDILTNNKDEYIKDTLTSTDEINEYKNSISFYPNPVRDFLYINQSVDQNYDFIIIEVSGRIIKQGKVSNSKIDFTNINSGIYLLKVWNTKEEHIIKIIKK